MGYCSIVRKRPTGLNQVEPRTGELSGRSAGELNSTPLALSRNDLGVFDNDLTHNYANGGYPVGERIVVHCLRSGFFRSRPRRRLRFFVWAASKRSRQICMV